LNPAAGRNHPCACARSSELSSGKPPFSAASQEHYGLLLGACPLFTSLDSIYPWTNKKTKSALLSLSLSVHYLQFPFPRIQTKRLVSHIQRTRRQDKSDGKRRIAYTRTPPCCLACIHCGAASTLAFELDLDRVTMDVDNRVTITVCGDGGCGMSNFLVYDLVWSRMCLMMADR
jgi:hypothetical protein